MPSNVICPVTAAVKWDTKIRKRSMIYYEDQGHSNNSEVAFQTSVGTPPSWRFVCYELWQEGNRKVRQQNIEDTSWLFCLSN